MDRWLIPAFVLLAIGALLTIAFSTFGLMNHYDAKVFVIVGGVHGLLLIFATDRKRRKDS